MTAKVIISCAITGRHQGCERGRLLRSMSDDVITRSDVGGVGPIHFNSSRTVNALSFPMAIAFREAAFWKSGDRSSSGSRSHGATPNVSDVVAASGGPFAAYTVF